MAGPDPSTDKVVIIGGGPGGYEAAHVAAQLGAQVTIVDTDGVGGSAVLTDCVPSKTLIATAEVMSELSEAAELGVNFQDADGDAATSIRVDLGRVNAAGEGAGDQPVRGHRAPAHPRRRRSSSRAAAGSTAPAG